MNTFLFPTDQYDICIKLQCQHQICRVVGLTDYYSEGQMQTYNCSAGKIRKLLGERCAMHQPVMLSEMLKDDVNISF